MRTHNICFYERNKQNFLFISSNTHFYLFFCRAPKVYDLVSWVSVMETSVHLVVLHTTSLAPRLSTRLSMKFKLLINIKTARYSGISMLKSANLAHIKC